MNKRYHSSSWGRKANMNTLEKDIHIWLLRKQNFFCESTNIPNKAIHAYGKLGQWENAVGVIWDMREMKVNRDVVTYTSAISACARAKQWKSALRLLQEMRRESIKPNVISYNASISACEKGLQWEKALELLSEMKNKGLQPNRF